MRALLIGGGTALALCSGAAAQTDHSRMTHSTNGPKPMGPPGPTLPTPDYLTAAGQSDQFEVQSGMMAEKMGRMPAVKSFGKMMVTEHGKTTRELMNAVKASGMSPPPPPPLKPEQQAMLDDLRTKSGDDFDRTYVSQQMMAHQEALSVQTGYAAGGDMPKIKATAAKTAPIVQSHINMLGSMQTKMGG